MPPQQPARASSLRGNDVLAASLGFLLTPALFAAVFTRRRFGIRTVGNLGRYLLGSLFFIAFHDIGGIAGHWHNPPFLESIAWDYFRVMYVVALWRLFEAWRSFRRREPRHSYSFGQPYLMLLGLPYGLAMLLDAAMIFGIGVWVRHYDVALGAWLMCGGGGLCILVLGGARQQFSDMADLMDAGAYADVIQDNVAGREATAQRPTPSTAGKDEELSTAAGKRRT